MTKEQLIKLAEVAGKNVFQMMDYDGMESWQPHKDIAQAFEVLEGWQENKSYIVQLIKDPDYHLCQLETPCRIPFVSCTSGIGKTNAEAICEAVLKAVD